MTRARKTRSRYYLLLQQHICAVATRLRRSDMESRDWVLFWAGWRVGSAASPVPNCSVGELNGLVDLGLAQTARLRAREACVPVFGTFLHDDAIGSREAMGVVVSVVWASGRCDG